MVFSNEEYREFFTDDVVFYKVTKQEGEEPDLKKRFGVIGYPTVILFSKEGEEIDRAIGFGGDGKEFMNMVKDWINGVGTLKTLLADAKEHPDDVHVMHALAVKYNQRYEQDAAVPYFRRILELDPDDAGGYGLESRFYIAMNVLETEGDPAVLVEFLAAADDENYSYRGQMGLLRYFQGKGDQKKTLDIYEEILIDRPEDANVRNGYAWYIYENRIEDRYDMAITAAMRAVELTPDSDAIWDTLAQLLFVVGRRQEAIDAMTKAVEISPDDEYYSGELKRFLENS